MKKFIVFVISTLLISSTFAYNPTLKDENLLKVLYSSFSKELGKDKAKASQYTNTLNALSILYMVKDSSWRLSYIFDSLSSYIQTNIVSKNYESKTITNNSEDSSKITKNNSTNKFLVNPTGQGTNISEKFYLPTWFFTIESAGYGQSNFIAKLLDENGDVIEYLVNEIGETNEIRWLKINKSWYYMIEVKHDGGRQFVITDIINKIANPHIPMVLEGGKTNTTNWIFIKKGFYKINSIHDWDSNFIVQLLDDKWNVNEYLVNEIGETNETTSIKIEKDGYYMFEVDADGKWIINISYM